MPRSKRTSDEMRFGRLLGIGIARRRNQLGWSGDKLARESGASVETVRRIERGLVASPGVYLTARVARALGTSTDALIEPALEAAAQSGGE